MIVLRHEGGKYLPIILCDVCEQRITDVGLANLVSRMPEDGHPDIQETMQVHQGKCMDIAEAKFGGKQCTGFDNLEDHLFCLMFSVGLTQERVQELLEYKKEYGV